MKRIFIATVFSIMTLVFSTHADADLTLLGQGTSTHGTFNLIYDTDLDITWLDYTEPYDTWQNLADWADGLSVTFGSSTHNDWRLPTTMDGVYIEGYDGTTTGGWNITSSEMGHLFYAELGNNGAYDTSGNPETSWGLTNTGDFQNLDKSAYWSGTEYGTDPTNAWYFNRNGFQAYAGKGAYGYAIAVMDGMAVASPVVPEPVSSVLFVTGGTLLAGRRFLKRKNRA